MQPVLLLSIVLAAPPSDPGLISQRNIAYPYVASPERQKQIKEGYNQVRDKMSLPQVKAILGTPDELRRLYEPKIKNAKQIGTTQWYFLEKKVKNQLNGDALVRVSFDLKGRVMKVDHWGFAEGGE